MAVGIYIRVSTEEQAKEGYSISAQREKLKAYCQVQDWNDFRFYVDEGFSAKDINRPQLQLMLQHIKEGMIDTVLVYRLDRLTRSVVDLYKLLELFGKHNCTFKSATEVYDTSTAIGRLFITLVAAMAQWERENLAERVRMGQIEKARQGKYSAKAPFGFDKGPDDRLVINEDEKIVVLDMIEKIKEGYSIRKLADYMDNSGIPPIRGYQWHIASILSILKNPALYGAVKWRDEIIEGAHEGIISKKEYNHLLKLLESRQNLKKRETYSIFIFQMKLICPTCGNRLTCERSVYFRKRDNRYVESNQYRCQACTLNKRKSIGVSERKMEKAFVRYMNEFKIEYTPKLPKKENEREKIQAQLMKIEHQRAKYQKAWANDFITDEEFSALMKETRSIYEELTHKLETLQPEEEQTVDKEKIKSIVTNFKLNWSYLSPDEKRQFINTFVESIQFEKQDGTVQILDVNFY
ncbi:recombinase family protein [Aeribacillus pallidus]|uniref:recombinase family protein n=1 Tax=Aeribacillus composti TaxID=1868734 RepID=UPI002E248126|nr:recombinase family protein [Aeribacillus composti]MED4488545.1 recombinase family protein [Aeribacillus pallidus]